MNLAGAAIVARYLAAVHDVGIERIGGRVTVLLDSRWMPIVKGNAPIVAAAWNACRTRVLLAAADAIGKCVVGGRMIHLRGGLVVPLRPGFAAVLRDDYALIAGQRNDFGVVGIDEDVLIIVSAGRAAKCNPCLARVGRLPRDDARHINGVGVFGVDERNRNIAAADALFRARVVVRRMHPVISAIIGAVETHSAMQRGDRAVDALRIGWRDGQIHLQDVIGQSVAGELGPGFAAIRRAIKTAFSTDKRAVFPGRLLTLPHARENDVWILRIDLNIRSASAVVHEEDPLEGLAAIQRAI